MKAIRMTQEDADKAQIKARAAWKRRGVDAGPAGRQEPLQKPVIEPKRSKHGAVKIVVDGITFASHLEARCWQGLKIRQAAGEIRNLRRQVRFSLYMNGGEHYGIYTADFVYEERIPGTASDAKEFERKIADAKSAHTRKLPAWQKVKLLMRNCHAIDVVDLP